MKRAHHSSLRIGREVLRGLSPLTPARFDLLYILHEEPKRFVDQKDLTRRLGLHHSTVSKMLTRLEELDLVYRELNEDDFRQRAVQLTARGRRLIREAIDAIFGDRFVTLAVDRAIAPLRWWSEVHSLRQIRRCNGTLRRYALAFYDTATPLYAPAIA